MDSGLLLLESYHYVELALQAAYAYQASKDPSLWMKLIHCFASLQKGPHIGIAHKDLLNYAQGRHVLDVKTMYNVTLRLL
jgi:hypothetical protein